MILWVALGLVVIAGGLYAWNKYARTKSGSLEDAARKIGIVPDDDVSTTPIGESTALPSVSPTVNASPQAVAHPTQRGSVMIAVFGTGSYVAVLPAGFADGIEQEGVYSFNYQNGITTHDDGNTTWKLVGPLPCPFAKVFGLTYLGSKGVLCLYAESGMSRLKTKPGAAPSDAWKADGEPL
jgi:hypothetical protein